MVNHLLDMAGPDFLKEKKKKDKRKLKNILYIVFLQCDLLLVDWSAFVKAVILRRGLFEDRFW